MKYRVIVMMRSSADVGENTGDQAEIVNVSFCVAALHLTYAVFGMKYSSRALALKWIQPWSIFDRRSQVGVGCLYCF